MLCLESEEQKIPIQRFKICNPANFHVVPRRVSRKTHDYPARFACADNCAAAFVHKKSTTQRSILYNGYKIWNNLPSEIKGLYKKSYFVYLKKVKKFILEK